MKTISLHIFWQTQARAHVTQYDYTTFIQPDKENVVLNRLAWQLKMLLMILAKHLSLYAFFCEVKTNLHSVGLICGKTKNGRQWQKDAVPLPTLRNPFSDKRL